jgi:hypothetical protein
MPSRLAVLVCSCALFVVAAPSSALAIDLCVPTLAACPGAIGTAQPSLQSALDLADNTNALDRVYLAAGTFTAPTTAGFSYTLATGPVEIAGAGSSGASKTVITSPAGSTRVLQLIAGAGSSLSDVELAVADNAATGSFQLRVRNVDIGNTVVTSSATELHTYTGVSLGDSSTFHDGSVTVSPTAGHAVLQEGPGSSIARATLTGYAGATQSASAVTATIDRVRIVSGDGGGVSTAGATVTVTNSLLLQGGTSPVCALSAMDQPSTDGVLNADGVTVVGVSGVPRGACGDSLFAAPRTATVNVANSIFRNLANDRSVVAWDTGAAAVNVAYSDFDPSTDLVVAGSTSLSPSQGMVGANNVTVDPLFLGPADYHLSGSSPVRDIGDPAASDGLDLDGLPRLCGRRDLGAFERQGGNTCVPVPAVGGGGGGGGGGGTPPPPPPPPTADTVAPVLTALALTHPMFRIARRGTALTGVAARVSAVGTTFRFTLSESANVTIVLQQRRTRAGRARGYVTRARLGRSAHAGRCAVAFSGRVKRGAHSKRVALSPGRYRAVLQAVDAAGNRGRSRTIAFRVVTR